MKYEELLEMHFWNGESYSPTKVLKILDYFKPGTVGIQVNYIDVNIDSNQIDENTYENFSGKSVNFEKINGNDELTYLLLNKFITDVKFKKNNNEDDVLFHVWYAGKYIYYTVEFGIENEDNIEEIFLKTQDTYCDLINIFNPLVSNAGFAVLWEDADRIYLEKSFEGLYGYLSKDLHFPFINMSKKVELENGYLFMKK